MNKPRLFIDMDGTLAVFKHVDTLETLYEPGYFRNLEPIQNMVDAVKHIIRRNPDAQVHILSSCLSDSPYALAEKNAWLDEHLPEIDAAHRIFPPCGEEKTAYVPGGIRQTDYLLDDYTYNLRHWQPPARGIKILNGINHTRGTWEHDRIRCDKPPDILARDIINVMNGAHVMDNKPSNDQSGYNANTDAELFDRMDMDTGDYHLDEDPFDLDISPWD